LYAVPLAVIFTGHLALGANSQALSLYFAIGQALAAIWIIGTTARPQLSPAERRSLVGAVALAGALITLMAISAGTWAISPWAAWLELLKLTALLLTAYAGFRIARSVKTLRPLLKVFMGLGSIYLALMLAGHFLLPGTVFGAEKASSEDRFTASFISANAAADLCVLLILTSASDLTVRLASLEQAPLGLKVRLVTTQGWLSTLTLGLAGFGLILTESRAGIALGLFALIGLVSWERLSGLGRRSRKLKGLMPVIGLGLVGVLATALALAGRFEHAAQSAQFRQMIWAEHWRAIIEQPWLGYGPGAFEALNRRLTSAENFDLFTTLGAMHNVYLQWLEQLGLLGSGLMWSLIGVVGWQVVRCVRRGGGAAPDLRLVIMISLFMLAHGLTDYGLEIPSLASQWSLVLGSALGLSLGAVGSPGGVKGRRRTSASRSEARSARAAGQGQ
jgi:O-antigen ligase